MQARERGERERETMVTAQWNIATSAVIIASQRNVYPGRDAKCLLIYIHRKRIMAAAMVARGEEKKTEKREPRVI